MKTLHCPLCGREFRVGDNVLAAYCDQGHMTAAYQQGLPAEDGLVYPIGWRAWILRAYEIFAGITAEHIAAFHRHYNERHSPADAVFAVFGVHP